jgi:hypothetical protein
VVFVSKVVEFKDPMIVYATVLALQSLFIFQELLMVSSDAFGLGTHYQTNVL